MLTPILFAATLAAADTVQVLPGEDAIFLTNVGTTPVYYEVFPRAALERIEWAPCQTREACQRAGTFPLAPGSGERVRLAAQGEAAPPRELVVFWWNLEEGPSGQRATPVRRIEVDLPEGGGVPEG